MFKYFPKYIQNWRREKQWGVGAVGDGERMAGSGTQQGCEEDAGDVWNAPARRSREGGCALVLQAAVNLGDNEWI
jgi:hypothetical protein